MLRELRHPLLDEQRRHDDQSGLDRHALDHAITNRFFVDALKVLGRLHRLRLTIQLLDLESEFMFDEALRGAAPVRGRRGASSRAASRTAVASSRTAHRRPLAGELEEPLRHLPRPVALLVVLLRHQALGPAAGREQLLGGARPRDQQRGHDDRLAETHLVGQDAAGLVRELAARRPLAFKLGAAPRLVEVLAVARHKFAIRRVQVRSIIYRGVEGAVLLRDHPGQRAPLVRAQRRRGHGRRRRDHRRRGRRPRRF
mmetsp:Transcript_1816/g.5126  ORF Transcript_1816/g.5126 Transcript_1816/m.5126 type:complete len:256 (+) Transcript_1816:2350-3117(+)